MSLPGIPPLNPYYSKSINDYPMYLTQGERACMYLPAKMSERDFELLKTQIDRWLEVVAETSVVRVEETPKVDHASDPSDPSGDVK